MGRNTDLSTFSKPSVTARNVLGDAGGGLGSKRSVSAADGCAAEPADQKETEWKVGAGEAAFTFRSIESDYVGNIPF